ncbi:MAG: hypothetical protein JXB47_04990 [Anaerolineae bacterium]|nr:hypothetical protein [Anaerolineae bacterium]
MGHQELIVGALLVIVGLLPLTNPDWMWMVDRVIAGIFGGEVGHTRANRVALQIIGAVSVLLGIILTIESISRAATS